MIQLLAFDLFGTIFDLKNVDREELKEYGRQINRNLGKWEPFDLPDHWAQLPLHDDAVEGLYALKESGYKLVTFSNAPAALQLRMLGNYSLPFHAITPLELFQMSKPNKAIYAKLSLWGYRPEECGMVTANESFGDIVGAADAGMKPLLIRGKDIPNLFELNKVLNETIKDLK